MNAWYYVKYLLLEGTYTVITGIYLFQLNAFNKKLLSKEFGSPFDLLVYQEWGAIKFFAIALILFGAGVAIAWRRGGHIRYRELSFGEVIASILALILVLIFLVSIIILINNPILRAIMVACGTGTAILYANSN